MPNETFCFGGQTWANACVGENGWIGYIAYAEGFSKAANLLLQYVLTERGKDADSFIYPICFNMRHSAELRLKGAVDELSKLSVLQNKALPEFNLEGSHHIGNIWNYYKEQSEYLDERFKKINAFMEQTILDIAEIDPTGQTFRYPYDINKKKHLVDQSIINCHVLYKKFQILEKNFSVLYGLTCELIDEYKLGSFTTKLSRSQIFKLAKDLPAHTQWSTDLDKDFLKEKYFLSSNNLVKAIDIIKVHYETSALIGIKKNLVALNDELIKELCSVWVKFNPNFRNLYTQALNSDHSNDIEQMLEEISSEQKLKGHWYPILMARLTKEHVADLVALYYFARDDLKYSENYLKFYSVERNYLTFDDINKMGLVFSVVNQNDFRFYDFKQKNLRCYNINQKNLVFSMFNHENLRFYDFKQKNLKSYEIVLDRFNHIFSKPEFLTQIVIALFFLYQTDLAEELTSKYLLENCTDRIAQARSRELFVKWEYLDYEI